MCLFAAGLAFLHQGHALVHAETVLLVHDHQAETGEIHPFLHQGVRADDHPGLAGNRIQRGRPRPARHLAAQPDRFDTQRAEPVAQDPQVLLSQQLGGSHDGDLVTVTHGAQRGKRRYHGLARSHVSVQQAQHRVWLAHVGKDLSGHPALRGGQFEGQGFQQAGLVHGLLRHHGGLARLLPAVQALHADVVRQQFFHGQAVLRRVVALHQRFDVRVGGRAVNEAHRVGQGGQPQVAGHGLGQQFLELQRPGMQGLERLVRQADPGVLTDTFGRRVDRRQPVRHGRLPAGGETLVAGVHHLQSLVAGAHLAETADFRAAGELLFLVRPEMEETQRDPAGAVGQHHHEHGPPRTDDRRVLDPALDQHAGARRQCADGVQLGAVLVAQGQVKQQVGDLVDAHVTQTLFHLRADAAQVGQLVRSGRAHCLFGPWCQVGPGSETQDGVHLDFRTFRQGGDPDGCPGGVGFGEVFAHDGVDLGEVCHVGQEYGELEDVVQ